MGFREPLVLIGLGLLPLAVAAYVAAQQRRRRFAVRYTNVDILASVATASWRRASSICVRSVVGATTCSAREPNLISPSRKSSGTWLVSVRAASRAAVRRSGRTS